MARALVTGAAGFVGRWLTRALAESGHSVHGMRMTAPDAPPAPGTDGVIEWHVGDLRDPGVLRAAVDAATPDLVFHLAGISSVGEAEADPGAAAEINVAVAARLLSELARSRDAGHCDPSVLVVGSAEQYGRHDEAELPLREDAEQRPLTTYAATKAAQEVVALQGWRRHGLRVVCARSFNHTGAGQSDRFLIPALVGRALTLRASGGDGGELRLGNTSPVRDVAHVSDVVAAYILLAERGVAGRVYNVCRGEGTSVRQMAETVLRRVGVAARLVEDPALVRPVDVPALVGDPTRLRADTGWVPRYTLDDCIDDLINAATH